MEPRRLPMLNLDVDFDNNADFDFTLLSAGSSSASISGLSYATSSYEPRTPVSGRTSPHFSTSFDLASSFSSVDTMPFDLTPSSSTSSSPFFPMTPTTDRVSNMVYPVFQFTPPREQLDFAGLPFSGGGNQFPVTQTMDRGYFVSQLGIHPPSTPPPTAQFDHMLGAPAHWMHPDSPIRFDPQSPSRAVSTGQSFIEEPENEVMTPPTPPGATRRRALMDEARHRTTALQKHVQQSPPPSPRPRAKRRRAQGAVAEGEGSFAPKVARSGSFRCPMDGCPSVYLRKEHMKRHINTVHLGSCFVCPFCSHASSRKDNHLSHLKLHAEQRRKAGHKEPRVKYFAAAVQLVEEELKTTRRKRRTTKISQRSVSPA